MDQPTLERSRTASTTMSVLAVLLLLAHVALDLVLAVGATFVAGTSSHDRIALALLPVLYGGFIALVVVSTLLAIQDQRTGRRSPAAWAGIGLLASIGLSIAFFVTLSALGGAPGA